MELTALIVTAVATAFLAFTGWGAWMAARASARTGDSLTAIERHRWHADLTPQFNVSVRATTDTTAQLRVELVGPVGLDRLDEVSITIRDDIRGRAPVTAGGPTAEQIAAQIWGPYKFIPGVDGADPHGRTVPPVELLLGDWRPFALERTLPPPWSATQGDGGHRWWSQYDDKPARITLRCRRVLTEVQEAAYHRTVDRITAMATLSDPLTRWAMGTREQHR